MVEVLEKQEERIQAETPTTTQKSTEKATEKTSFGKFGLSSLFGDSTPREEAPEAETEKDSEYLSVPTTRISVGNFQPRTNFDATSLKELSESIAKNGILQPIIVRKKFGGEFEIIAGERRWRAAKLLNLQYVPVIVRQLPDKEVFELAIVENVQRQDLSPLEEAYAYRRLLGEFGYTQDDLARTVGKSRSHIANLLRLLSLPEKIKNLLSEGKITMGHARSLLAAPNPEELANQIVEQGLSVRQVEEIVSGDSDLYINKDVSFDYSTGSSDAKTASSPNKSGKTTDILALEEILQRNLGSKVDIKSKGKKGEIKIKYKSLEELDSLLAKLGAAA